MRIAVIIIIIGCIYSCSDRPGDVMDRDTMEKVLFDYVSADVYSKEQLKDSTKNDTVVNTKLQDKIFKKYNITRPEFEKAYAYYSKDPERFKSLLDSTVAKQQRKDTAFIKKGIIPVQAI